MRHELILVLSFSAIVSMFASVDLNSAFAQNMTGGNMTSAVNMTNATSGGNMTGRNTTTSDTAASSAKFHLEEGIKALQAGDIELAKTHLMAAQQTMSNPPPDAMRHFEEGMKALDSGDNEGAIMHLNIANKDRG
jgi:hypothetical protein